MTTYITLDGDAGRPTISVDGVHQPSDFPLRWVDRANMPFAGVYIADERQFDIEVWVNGTCQHRVPPEDEQTRRIYDAIEGKAVELPGSQSPPEGHREQVQAEMRAHPGGKAHFRWKGLTVAAWDVFIASDERVSTSGPAGFAGEEVEDRVRP